MGRTTVGRARAMAAGARERVESRREVGKEASEPPPPSPWDDGKRSLGSPGESTSSSSLKKDGLPAREKREAVEIHEEPRQPASAAQQELALIPLTDDVHSPIVTSRSVIVGCLVAVLGAAVTQITALLLGRAAAWKTGPLWWNPERNGVRIADSDFSECGCLRDRVQELFFDEVASFGVSFGILLSSQLIGYGWAGLLQPILVYPTQVFYPDILPSVSLFYSLCGDGPVVKDQISFFKKAFMAMGLYEIFPAYIAPAFQAISVFCLSLPKSPLITNIFGGAEPFEGLGFLNISADWALVGSHGPLYTPLTAQVHHIIGVMCSVLILSYVYTNSWYVSLLTSNGTLYPIKSVINENGSPNEEVITEIGIPFFTSTYVAVQIVSSLAVTSAITHVLLQNYPIILAIFRKSPKNVQVLDPHRAICKKYKDFPTWAFGLILIVSIALALGLSSLSKSGLPAMGLLFAIFLSSILTLAVSFLSAITGFHLHVSGVVQMFGGLLFPGNAFGNMWFTTFGASTVNQSVNMLKDLKLGQYMHLPQRLVVLAQLIGTLVGICVNYGVMKIIIHTQREILLTSGGDGVFSGVAITSFQSSAVSWGAFAKRLFLADEKYGAIPLALAYGLFIPVPFFILHRYFPGYGFNLINVPLLAGSVGGGYTIATAGKLGGDGKKVTFPTYFLNPDASIPKDYCYKLSV
ncbi:hypothetical protein VP01_409g5 [Puccinia sorghi]|uniref:OPT family small oligopeptide transporter protein n=1 Tax=Puccinia sorghi TaxID=27349 RepID=A0A0L6URB6_9BASI|nr:hypothetical protein VP01_409g5 [Puccinia sorghi]